MTARPSRITLPQRIETPRLVLRTWRPTDAPLLKAAIDGNLEHLRAWLRWAQQEPSTVETVTKRIERFDRAFRAESEWAYAIFSSGERMLYGGAGVRRSTERGGMEVGFWLGASWTKQGFATEAVKALSDHVMALPGIERVEIRCDVRNTAGVAVARRAGFEHRTTLARHVSEPGAPPRDTAVWCRSHASRPAASPAPQQRGLWSRIRAFFGGRG